jgi:hypothetical protein
MSPFDIMYGNVDSDGWDDMELEFEEVLTLYTFFLYGDEARMTFWDKNHLYLSKDL